MKIYLTKMDCINAAMQPISIFGFCVIGAITRFPQNLHKPFFWSLAIGLPLSMYFLLLTAIHFVNRYRYGPKNYKTYNDVRFMESNDDLDGPGLRR